MQTEKSFRNPDHSNQVLGQISELWKSKLICDAAIEVGPVKVYTHRLVLVASCPWLATLLGKVDQNLSNLEIKLPGHVGIDALNSLLSYLYDGVLYLNQTNFRQIENLANILKVPKVIEYCQEFHCYLRSLETKSDEIAHADVIPTTYIIGTRKSTLVITCKEKTQEDYIERSSINTPKKTNVYHTSREASNLSNTFSQTRSSQHTEGLKNTPHLARTSISTPQQDRVLGDNAHQTRSSQETEGLKNSPQLARTLSNTPQQARGLNVNVHQTRSSQETEGLKNTPQLPRTLSNTPQQARGLNVNVHQTRSSQETEGLKNTPQLPRTLSKTPQQARGSGDNVHQTRSSQETEGLKNTPQLPKTLSKTPQQARGSGDNVHQTRRPQQTEDLKNTPQLPRTLSNTPQQARGLNVNVHQTRSSQETEGLKNTPQLPRTLSKTPQQARGSGDNVHQTRRPQQTEGLKNTPQLARTLSNTPRQARGLNVNVHQTRSSQETDGLKNTPQQARTLRTTLQQASGLSNTAQQTRRPEQAKDLCYNAQQANSLNNTPQQTKKRKLDQLESSNQNLSSNKILKKNVILHEIENKSHDNTEEIGQELEDSENFQKMTIKSFKFNKECIKQEPQSDTGIYSMSSNKYNENSDWSSCVFTSNSVLSSSSSSIGQPTGSYTGDISVTHVKMTESEKSFDTKQDYSVVYVTSSLTHNGTETTLTPSSSLNPLKLSDISRHGYQLHHKETPVPILSGKIITNNQTMIRQPTVLVGDSSSGATVGTSCASLQINPISFLDTSRKNLRYLLPAQGNGTTSIPKHLTTSTVTYTLSSNLSIAPKAIPVTMTASTLTYSQNVKLSTTAPVSGTTSTLTHLQNSSKSKTHLTTVHIVRPTSSLENSRIISQLTSAPFVGSVRNGRQYLVLPSIRPASTSNCSEIYTYHPNNPGLPMSPNSRMFVPVTPQFIVRPTAQPELINTQMPSTFSFASSPNVLSTNYSSQRPSKLLLHPMSFVVPKNTLSSELPRSGAKPRGRNETLFKSQNLQVRKTVPASTSPLVSLLNTRSRHVASSQCQYATNMPGTMPIIGQSILNQENTDEDDPSNLYSALEKSVSEMLPVLSMPVIMSESEAISVPGKVYKNTSKVIRASGVDMENNDASKNQKTSEFKDDEINSTCSGIKMSVQNESQIEVKKSFMESKSKKLDKSYLSKEKENKNTKVQTVLSQSNQSNDNTSHVTEKINADLIKTNQSSSTQKAPITSSEHQHNMSTGKSLKRKNDCLSSADTAMECSNPKLPNMRTKPNRQSMSGSLNKTKLSQSVKERLVSGLHNYWKHLQDVREASKTDHDNSLSKDDQIHGKTDQSELTPVGVKSGTPGQTQKMSNSKPTAMKVKSKGAVILKNKSNQEVVCRVTPVNSTSSVRSNHSKISAVPRGKSENRQQKSITKPKIPPNQSVQHKSSGPRSSKNKASTDEGKQTPETGNAIVKQVNDTHPPSNKPKQSNERSKTKVNDAVSSDDDKQETETASEFRNQVIDTKQRSASNQIKQKQGNHAVPAKEQKHKTEAKTQTINTQKQCVSCLPIPSSDLCRNKSSGYEQIYSHSQEEKNLNSKILTNDNETTKSTLKKKLHDNKSSSIEVRNKEKDIIVNVDRQGVVTSKERCANNKDTHSVTKDGYTSNKDNCREGSKEAGEKAISELSQLEKYEDKKCSNTENSNIRNKYKPNMIMNVKDSSVMVEQRQEKISLSDRFRDNNKTTSSNSNIARQKLSNINTVESYYTANYNNKDERNKNHIEGHEPGNVKETVVTTTGTVAMVSNSSPGQVNTGAGDSHVIPSTTPLTLLANMAREKIKYQEGFPFPATWGVGVFRDWLIHKGLSPLFEDMENTDLDDILMEFYPDIKSQESSTLFSGALHIIRNSIIKHFESPRQLNTNNCKGLMYSNAVFEELTNEKCPITAQGPIRTDDFKKMYKSNVLSDLDPVSLQRKIWFEITLFLNDHWNSLIDGMLSLKKDSFILCTDANGKHYYEIRPDASWNNSNEGGIGQHQGRVKCCIQHLHFYLSKLHPNCNAFFQKPNVNVKQHKFWYLPNPLCKFRLKNMMSQISIDAKLSCIYTNTAVKTTSVRLLQN